MSEKIPKLISVKKIWDYGVHNGMTDLIYYKKHWYCIFREGTNHVGGRDGIIRLLMSRDGEEWESVHRFIEPGVDLRDPKLSVTPDGRLMILAGGTIYRDRKYISRQSRVTFSSDGIKWTPFQLVVEPHEWLWRITWHQGKAYGVSYSYSDPTDSLAEWNIKLFESDDGVRYQQIVQWPISEYPNETTLHFLENDRMLALVRRDGANDCKAWLGISDPPYTDWKWHVTHSYLGGPNFIILPDKRMFAAGRIIFPSPYMYLRKTVLASLSLTDFQPLVFLPSSGDCSYPGLVYHEGMLWMSYYSSHEGHSSIYLAKFEV